MKDLVCLSELPLIPMLHQSELSACGCCFVLKKESFPVQSWWKICSFSLLNIAELVSFCFVVTLVISWVSQFLVILFASAEDHEFRGG